LQKEKKERAHRGECKMFWGRKPKTDNREGEIEKYKKGMEGLRGSQSGLGQKLKADIKDKTIGQQEKIDQKREQQSKTDIDDKFRENYINNREFNYQIDTILGILKQYPAHLFIFESKLKLYFYVTIDDKYQKVLENILSLSQNENSLDTTPGNFEEMITKYLESKPIRKLVSNDFEKEILYHIKNENKEGIITMGEKLRDALIPEEITTMLKEELKNDPDKIKNVWIFEENNIDHLWEWIYWEEKNFFWGDNFHIVRIPENYKFTNPNFQINNATILSDANCRCADDDKDILHNKLGSIEEIGLLKTKRYKKLGKPNCIHIVVNIETFDKEKGLYNALRNVFKKTKLSNLQGVKKPNFLFLNIRAPTSEEQHLKPDEIDKIIHEIRKIFDSPAETWIDTNLPLPDSPTPQFAEYFYEMFLKNKDNVNVVEAVAKAREEIEKQKDIGCKSFWRLAYVVKGNPYAMVTWDEG
jgi:hypothetical protein